MCLRQDVAAKDLWRLDDPQCVAAEGLRHDHVGVGGLYGVLHGDRGHGDAGEARFGKASLDQPGVEERARAVVNDDPFGIGEALQPLADRVLSSLAAEADRRDLGVAPFRNQAASLVDVGIGENHDDGIDVVAGVERIEAVRDNRPAAKGGEGLIDSPHAAACPGGHNNSPHACMGAWTARRLR